MAVQTKDQLWEDTFDIVARTVDGQGRRIDLGIMGVVLGLNAHNVKTTFSCEGHLDHGNPYPWVWIDSESAHMLKKLVHDFGGSLKVEQLFDDTYELACSVGNLPDEQAEMLRFAEWLRDRFFEVEV